jgi:hypothetical protein
VALWKPWARPRWRWPRPAAAFALAAALAAALPAAACTTAPASSGANAGSSTGRAASPAVTAAQARQVFDRYVAAAAAPTAPHAAPPVLSLVTGAERSVLSAALASHTVVSGGASPSTAGAYRSSLSITPGLASYAYGSPTFYLSAAAGYPRFFVASATRTLRGTRPADGTTTEVGDTRVPVDGTALMLFEQADAGAPWLLASTSSLAAGATPPKLATDGAGYIQAVTPTAATLLAQPEDVGPLQAAVVDDGPASAATKAVAGGQLSTGMYQGAVSHASGLTAPPGDVYQWELGGANFPVFALRTAGGGALVFYAMTLTTTVAVPDVINKGNPIHSGPPIQVPVDLRMLLPADQRAPLVQLESEQTLSFAAIDPTPGTAKIQVIALGGGLTSASAS